MSLAAAAQLLAALTLQSAEFYAAPDGSPGGDGSIANPWNLQAALAQPGSVIRPGDTLWLRGGDYIPTGARTFVNALNGTAGAPIIVRQYPQERATLHGGLYSGGSWTWFWGFEITNPDPERNVTNDFARPEGFEIHGRGVKAIDLVIHDTGHPGLGFWKQIGDGAEVYGCILWGNGIYDWSSGSRNIRGAGIYGQGQDRNENRFIKDSIFFRNFTQGLHLYSTAAGVYVNGCQIEGNIFFNNGDNKENLFVGTVAQPCERIKASNNCSYFDPGSSGTGLRFGYGALNNTNLTVQDNYVVGGSTSVRLDDWLDVTFAGNTLIGSRSRLLQMNYGSGLLPLDYRIDLNTYATASASPFWYSDAAGAVNFTQWKTVTRYDANSPFTTINPTASQVFVHPNHYERGRAHIAVFNWALQRTVRVDLSASGLMAGENYEIRDAQNYFGPPVASGTYTGASVDLPMNLTEVPALVGNVTHIINRHTGLDFGAFVLVPAAGPFRPAPRLTKLRTAPAVTITWTSVPDKTYRLQYKNNLGDANWTDLGNPVTATNTSTSASDNTGSHTRRFYRVLLLD
jgi:hypothetical protein